MGGEGHSSVYLQWSVQSYRRSSPSTCPKPRTIKAERGIRGEHHVAKRAKTQTNATLGAGQPHQFVSFALFILRRARSTLSARSAHPTRTAGTPPRSVHLFVGSRRASAGPLQGQARTCRSLSVACRGRRSSGVNRSLRTGTCSGQHPPHSTCERHLNVCQPLPTPQNSARTSTLAQPTPPVTLVGVWTRGARPRGPGWHAGMGRRGICCANLAARSSVDPIFSATFETRRWKMGLKSADCKIVWSQHNKT